MIFTRSIRWRLQAWHALLLTAVIAGFGITAHRLASSDRLRAVDQELQSHVTQLGIAVPPTTGREVPRRPGSRPPSPPRGSGLLDQIEASGVHFAVWSSDGMLQTSSANLPAGTALPPRPKEGDINFMRTVGEVRQAVYFNNSGRCFLVGRPIQKETAGLRQLAWYLTLAGSGVLALGLLGGWWMAARAMRPIAAISDTAEKIATGDLSQRIPTTAAEDELGRLASVLNSTFSRLEAAFAQQSRFTADAAHELRTPVSVMLMHAQNGLASEPLTSEQREAFEACQRAAQRMRRLIESLLELTRLDAGQECLKRELFNLDGIVGESSTLLLPIAQAQHMTMDCDLNSAPALGDADRMAQVITNLVMNAIEYGREGGRISLRTGRENGCAIAIITDNGPGISQENLPHIFGRFYRADASRSNCSRGNGLGLAISKAIIEAHGGTIEAISSAGEGTTFTIRLPATD